MFSLSRVFCCKNPDVMPNDPTPSNHSQMSDQKVQETALPNIKQQTFMKEHRPSLLNVTVNNLAKDHADESQPNLLNLYSPEKEPELPKKRRLLSQKSQQASEPKIRITIPTNLVNFSGNNTPPEEEPILSQAQTENNTEPTPSYPIKRAPRSRSPKRNKRDVNSGLIRKARSVSPQNRTNKTNGKQRSASPLQKPNLSRPPPELKLRPPKLPPLKPIRAVSDKPSDKEPAQKKTHRRTRSQLPTTARREPRNKRTNSPQPHKKVAPTVTLEIQSLLKIATPNNNGYFRARTPNPNGLKLQDKEYQMAHNYRFKSKLYPEEDDVTFDSEVRHVIHKKTQEEFALKFVNKKSELDLKTEFEIQHVLSHENIVKLYYLIEYEKRYCFLFELMETDLQRCSTKTLSEEELCSYFIQMLSGITYLHKNGIIHRDIKAENMLLTKEGKLKIGDFGFAKKITEDGLHTPKGSTNYAAPEIWKGDKYGFKADLWSLGVTLFALTFQDLPWKGKAANVVIMKVTDDEEPIPFPEDSTYSEDLKDLIRGLLTRDPLQRLGDISDGYKALFDHPWVMRFAGQT